jgi:hypothetical protein
MGRTNLVRANGTSVITRENKGKENHDPRRLMKEVLAGLRLNLDTTLNGWCRRNRLDRDYMRASILGLTNTPRARRMRAKVMQAAGLTEGCAG